MSNRDAGPPNPRRRYFGSFRLPAVIAVVCLIGIVGVSFVASLSIRAREAVNLGSCRSNLKMIGVALDEIGVADGRFPAAATGDPAVSWRVALLPRLDLESVRDKYNDDAPWNAPINESVAGIMIWNYRCPAAAAYGKGKDKVRGFEVNYADYSMVTGPGTVGRGVKPNEITDGRTNTCLVLEACDLQIAWTEPRDVDITSLKAGVNLSPPSSGWLSSHHRSGAHALFSDGHVSFISSKTDPKVLKAMMTIDAGDVVESY